MTTVCECETLFIQLFVAVALTAIAQQLGLSPAETVKIGGPLTPTAKADRHCFLCKGHGQIGRSPEAQGWYRARKACLDKAQGDRRKAGDMLRSLESQYDLAQRGQVRDAMGRACDKIAFYRT